MLVSLLSQQVEEFQTKRAHGYKGLQSLLDSLKEEHIPSTISKTHNDFLLNIQGDS